MSLKFIALSGTVSVTENLYVYESGNQMMVVDCGVGFPDLEMHGVDLVIPDFSYVVRNKNKLKGIVLSQGHEDHIGALPFLLREVRTEIWTAPYSQALLSDKFKDYGIEGVKMNVFDPGGNSFNVGIFRVYPFRVTHSIPDAVGFAIDTPEGRIFHVPEHKMDQNPIDKMPFDIKRARSLASKGTLFLASDCLGANKPGYTKQEGHIEENIFKIVKNAKKAVYFTAISSNIGRFQQAINVAKKTNRKIVFVGRSVQKKCEIAHSMGYLKYSGDMAVSLRQTKHYPDRRLMYIIAGCYGQVGSSLHKLSLNEHDMLKANEGDTLIFSADPAPPYTKESENFVIDNFIDMGMDVHYYDLEEDLYVSGHGSQEDILALFRIVNPQYFIPIGGAIRFMHSYKKLAFSFGARPGSVFELKPGESVIFENGQVRRGKKIPVKEVLVHGLGIGDVGKVVLGDRAVLGKEGLAVAVIKFGRKKQKVIEAPTIISRGFVFEKEEKPFLIESAKKLKKELDSLKKLDRSVINDKTVNFLTGHFLKQTGRRPMVLPVIVEM
jgi:ribonuclease J